MSLQCTQQLDMHDDYIMILSLHNSDPQAKYTSSRFLNPLVLVVIAEYNIVSVDKSIAS